MSSLAHRPRAPILWLLLPFLAGLAIAGRQPLTFAPATLAAAALGLALLAIGAACVNRRMTWAATLGLSMLLAGIALLQQRWPHFHDPPSGPPREITVTATIDQLYASAPDARSANGLIRILPDPANDVRIRDSSVYLSVLQPRDRRVSRGGTYRLKGVLEPVATPHGNQGFDAYLVSMGIRHRLVRARVLAEMAPPPATQRFYADMHQRLRQWLSEGLARWPGERSLYLGIVLGEKAEFTSRQQAAFMRSGTFHIFSVSGLHVGTLALALGALAWWLRIPLRWAAVVIVPLLWCYAQVTGGSSPALRAFIMVVFLLASRVFRLPGNALAALATSALVTLLLEPAQLFSSGFQMSYTVVAALVLMGAPLTRHWLAKWRPFALRPPGDWRWWHHALSRTGAAAIAALAAGWTAFLASTPSSIAYFGLLSPVSLVANLAAVPLSTGILYLGLLAMVAGAALLTPVAVACNRLAVWLVMLAERSAGLATTPEFGFFAATFRGEPLGPIALAGTTAILLAGASGQWSRRWGGFLLPALWIGLWLIFGVKFGAAAQSSAP